MPAQISREYRIYLALWRKAYLGEKLVSVKVPNLSMGVSMRQGMYRAIKPFRHGQSTDEELRQAAEKYVVYLTSAPTASEPHYLEFRERLSLALLERDLGELGIEEDDLLLGDERQAEQSLKNLISDEDLPRPLNSTPFYVREG